MRTPSKTTAAKPGAEKPATEKPAAGAATEAGATAKVEAASAPAGSTPPAGSPAPGTMFGTERARVDQQINSGIADALAGRRDLPTPEAEAGAAIAEASIDPRPGAGTLDGGFETRFEPLTAAEIAVLNAQMALLSASDLAAFRGFLAEPPIDPLRGQGSLDDRRPIADRLNVGPAAFLESRAARPMPPGLNEDRGWTFGPGGLDPDKDYIEVKASRDGHRRAGRRWSTTPVMVEVDALSSEDLQQLIADPSLTVRSV